MRRSRYDPVVVLVSMIVFLYSFFCGIKRIEVPPSSFYPTSKVVFEIPTSLIIAPLVCIVFFLLWVFADELEKFTVRGALSSLKKQFIAKFRERR